MFSYYCSVSSSAVRLSGTASGGIIKSRLVRGVGGGGAHSASTGAAAGKSKAGAKEGQPLRAAALSKQVLAAKRILSASRNRKSHHHTVTSSYVTSSKAGAKEGQPLRAAALSSYADTEQEPPDSDDVTYDDVTVCRADTEQEPPDSASPSKGEFIYIQ